MATWEDFRGPGLVLPGVTERPFFDEPSLAVGRKSLAIQRSHRVLMKLDRHHQEFLFEVRPDVFSPFNSGAMRWAWVEIETLDADEVADLVREAWRQVVPKKVSRAYDAR